MGGCFGKGGKMKSLAVVTKRELGKHILNVKIVGERFRIKGSHRHESLKIDIRQ